MPGLEAERWGAVQDSAGLRPGEAPMLQRLHKVHDLQDRTLLDRLCRLVLDLMLQVQEGSFCSRYF